MRKIEPAVTKGILKHVILNLNHHSWRKHCMKHRCAEIYGRAFLQLFRISRWTPNKASGLELQFTLKFDFTFEGVQDFCVFRLSLSFIFFISDARRSGGGRFQHWCSRCGVVQQRTPEVDYKTCCYSWNWYFTAILCEDTSSWASC